MQTLTFIAEILRKYPLWMLMMISLVILATAFDAATIITLAPIIESFTNTSHGIAGHLTGLVKSVLSWIGLPANMISYLLLLLIFSFVKGSFNVVNDWLVIKIRFQVIRDLTLEMFDRIFKTRWSFFTSNKQGTLLNTFTKEVDNVGGAFDSMAIMFSKTFELLAYFILPFYISWQVTSLTVITSIIFFFPLMFVGKISTKLGKKNTIASNRLMQVLQQSLGGAKVILGFGNQKQSYIELEKNISEQVNAKIHSKIFQSTISNAYGPPVIITMGIALLAVRYFNLAASDAAVLLFALYRTTPYFGAITVIKNRIDHLYPSYFQVQRIKEKAENHIQISGEKHFESISTEILCQGIKYSFPGNNEPVINNISIRIPSGRMVAIVGESGAGKSTLIDVFMGFIEPLSGEIMVDGVSLNNYDILSYRRRIGYVPQESVLFNGSIIDNLRWAKKNASKDEITVACRLANADVFIDSFPDGYDTIIGDRGIRLSGGQAQRVSLARAIIRKPALLVLDEATSSLDSQSEHQIQKAIEKIAQETTILVVAHRLSTIKNSDHIYVLSGGRIVEEGVFTELNAKNSYFAKMIEAQLLV